MDKEQLINFIDRYWRCKSLLTTKSKSDAYSKLKQIGKYGFAAELMRQEASCWMFVSEANQIAGKLPERECEFLLSVFRINTLKKANTSRIAKELGISPYAVSRLLKSTSTEIKALHEGR